MCLKEIKELPVTVVRINSLFQAFETLDCFIIKLIHQAIPNIVVGRSYTVREALQRLGQYPCGFCVYLCESGNRFPRLIARAVEKELGNPAVIDFGLEQHTQKEVFDIAVRQNRWVPIAFLHTILICIYHSILRVFS